MEIIFHRYYVYKSFSLLMILVVLKRTGCSQIMLYDLLGAGVLGDGLGALRDGVLGQLTGQ